MRGEVLTLLVKPSCKWTFEMGGWLGLSLYLGDGKACAHSFIHLFVWSVSQSTSVTAALSTFKKMLKELGFPRRAFPSQAGWMHISFVKIKLLSGLLIDSGMF